MQLCCKIFSKLGRWVSFSIPIRAVRCSLSCAGYRFRYLWGLRVGGIGCVGYRFRYLWGRGGGKKNNPAFLRGCSFSVFRLKVVADNLVGIFSPTEGSFVCRYRHCRNMYCAIKRHITIADIGWEHIEIPRWRSYRFAVDIWQRLTKHKRPGTDSMNSTTNDHLR